MIAVRDSGRGRRNLVAYVVRATGAVTGDGDAPEPSALELRGWLRERLPEPMVPAMIVFVEALPLLPSGKIDHVALAALTPETRRSKRITCRLERPLKPS